MKTAITTSAISAVICVAALAQDSTDLHGDPYIPVGTLNIDQAFVATGERAQLSWDITYPKTIGDIVEIDPSTDKLTTKQEARIEVRIIGATHEEGAESPDIALQTRLGNRGRWETLFYGADSSVSSSDVVFEQVVKAGTTVDFAARAQSTTDGWHSSRNTVRSNPNVQALSNGDSLDAAIPTYDQSQIESYLTSHVDGTDTIKIGPRDIVYLFELAENDTSSDNFDLQDIAVIVTFHDVE
jgi:hypothetical protein